ncbi:hypothetical protein DPMN_015329 [Dreissena polymorpha]|uniref:Uncharacterized protein n=1 Tax=Dreissena polymorpha TaxID=45954 RepID=A0A9D4NBD2_DREPO|nr:hypothetical protein DPMN_015329 [Dreissena polymorpha]
MTKFLQDTGWKNYIIVREINKEYDALAEILESTLGSFNEIGFRVTQVHKLHEPTESGDDIDATLNSIKHEGRSNAVSDIDISDELHYCKMCESLWSLRF